MVYKDSNICMKGYTHVIFDIEIWNKTSLIIKENGLKGNVVDLLDN